MGWDPTDNSMSKLFAFCATNSKLLYLFHEKSQKSKKAKNCNYTAEIIVEIEERHGHQVLICCLLNTGTTQAIIPRELVQKGCAKGYKCQKTVWYIMGGSFTTKQKVLHHFKFSELDNNKTVT